MVYVESNRDPVCVRGETMKPCYAVVALLLLLSPVLGATISNTFSAQGVGAITRSSDINWGSSVDNTSVGGNSGSVMLTAPGEFQYQTKDHIDATAGNFYNQTGYARFDKGGVFSETLNVEGSDPYQSVAVSHYGVLPMTEMDSAKTVNGVDLDMGQQVQWAGSGNLFKDVAYSVDAVRQTMGSTYRYRTTGADHAGVQTNMSGGAIVRPEFSFTSFSNAFIFNDTSLQENITNNSTSDDVYPSTMGAM